MSVLSRVIDLLRRAADSLECWMDNREYRRLLQDNPSGLFQIRVDHVKLKCPDDDEMHVAAWDFLKKVDPYKVDDWE